MKPQECHARPLQQQSETFASRASGRRAPSCLPGRKDTSAFPYSMAGSMLRQFAAIAACRVLLAAAVVAQEPSASSSTPSSQPTDAVRPRWMLDPEKVHDPSAIMTVDGVRRSFCTGPGVLLLR